MYRQYRIVRKTIVWDANIMEKLELSQQNKDLGGQKYGKARTLIGKQWFGTPKIWKSKNSHRKTKIWDAKNMEKLEPS